ncbi:hypothetical protein GCM10017044_05340 [Kordiimonas sediminis]|uniref:Flagellar protein FliL n=1 Tax=Kordiimonas sediminis TaxID=1735581 RepID=A0A919E2Z2_9PROT|nr:hypothetical protein [Kordiimonas sediminis]GHF14178.1 hypothetical protein GCM10017044_05340 [Kordiimonas sediminis]
MMNKWTYVGLIAAFLATGASGVSAHPVFEEDEDTEAAEQAVSVFEMQPITFNMKQRSGGRGVVTINLALEILNDTPLEEVTYREPQLKADFGAALVALSRQAFSVDRPIDPNLVTAYLTPFADRRLGKGAVKIYVVKSQIVAK